MSFKFRVSPKDRASAKFIGNVQRAVAAAVANAGRQEGLTQKQIADKLGVNKSTVSRIVSGKGNITLRTLAELAWAMDLKPELALTPIDQGKGANAEIESDGTQSEIIEILPISKGRAGSSNTIRDLSITHD